MTDSDQRIDFLRGLFEHYLALPRQSAGHDFKERLSALQQWEMDDIQRRHAAACSDDKNYEKVLKYYLEELHNGLRLQGMIDRGPSGIENARRLDKAYQLFANAIEFSVLSAAIQDHVVEQLGNKPITPQSYALAVSGSDDLDERKRRLELLVEIGHEVAPHLGSRLIHTGFRLLKGLFRSGGLIDIHHAGDRGFRQLRQVPRLAQTLALFARTELSHLENLTTA